jgi:hypothetical protein
MISEAVNGGDVVYKTSVTVYEVKPPGVRLSSECTGSQWLIQPDKILEAEQVQCSVNMAWGEKVIQYIIMY